MDGIGKISGITGAASTVAALRPVAVVQREGAQPQPAVQAASIAQQAAEAEKAAKPENDRFERVAEALGELFVDRLSNSKLRINLDRDAGRFVMQTVDIDSGEVVAQFPAEEMLRILSYYRQESGLVVDDSA